MKPLVLYRDDGPIARRINGTQGWPPSLMVLAGIVPLALAIAFAHRSTWTAAWALGAFVILGSNSRLGDLDRDRFAWAVPALLRAGEYAALIWLSPVGALPLLIALAFRHYDLVYGLRYRGAAPSWPSGGWDGRLVLAWLLYAVGALPAGFYVLGGILGALFVAECVTSWRDHEPQGDPTP